jgi:alpha-beta hydrolase superfamily lysophospholipase
VIERCCQLGAHRQLASVITMPEQQARRGLVLVSAGIVPKFGPYRLYAQLARRLARDGIATLRLDLSGVGDSSHEHAHLPLAQRTALEIRVAVDELARASGVDTVIVGGLCSGAEDALRYAELDTRVTCAVLIEPFAYRTAGWQVRDLIYRARRRALRAAGIYEPIPLSPKQGRIVRYEYMAQAESSRILRALLARDGRVHFIYTGNQHERLDHARVAKMFPDLDLSRLVTVDHFPQVDHTQILDADRHLVIESIARALRR